MVGLCRFYVVLRVIASARAADKRKRMKAVLIAILGLLVAGALGIAVTLVQNGQNGGWLLGVFAIIIFINGIRSR